jgi:hypothetical protein
MRSVLQILVLLLAPTVAGSAMAQAPYPQQQPYPQQPYPQQPYPQQPSPQPGWYGGDRQPSSRGALIAVSIMPFVSVILFFLTGMVWGYQYSWLWFLLIPLVGAVAYGAEGGRRR